MVADFKEKSLFKGTAKEFIYEGARDKTPHNAPKKNREYYGSSKGSNYRSKGEDTRSLYDDPKL